MPRVGFEPTIPVFEQAATENDIWAQYLPTGSYKLHGLSPRANYTDRATDACRRS
jgi:hypothetical protein